MRATWIIGLAAACGGSKPAATPARDEVVEKKQEPTDEAPAAPDEPAVAKSWYAKAALEPVKGAKVSPVTVSFTQSDGEDAHVSADVEGTRPGKYRFVIHDSNECGPNATKAGDVWKGGEAVSLV